MNAGPDIDPRLGAQIDSAGETGQVEAILLLSDAARAGSGGDDRGAGGPVVDRVTAEIAEKPTALRFLPALGALFVRGSGRLIRGLLAQREVVSATASDDSPGPTTPAPRGACR
ncbi:MAG TPA: hypothetical protein VGF55_18340 [Gemmataceae bacterium]|jgi:hypothetical protein